MQINYIKTAIKALQDGKMIILIDDENRENEGDFVVAAEKITPEQINFMATHGRGLICLSMIESEAKRLDISLMVNDNQSQFGTGFGISIEAASGITTGSSAFDRAHTIRTAVNPKSSSKDIAKPGHIFTLISKKGGVLERPGHTEGSIDLVKIAELLPQAVICEIMRKDGNMAKLPELKKIAQKYHMPIVSIAEIAAFRAKHDPLLKISAKATLPSKWGNFNISVFEMGEKNETHVAISSTKKNKGFSLVRVHSSCLTGDIFGSLRCDCGFQLETALKMIAEEGGALIYLSQEGRNIGLTNKIKAYALQEKYDLDTVEANHQLGFRSDHRHYMDAAQILHQLGLTKIKLLTNNPQKLKELQFAGIEIVERVSLQCPTNKHNARYLKTKQKKLKHLLENL